MINPGQILFLVFCAVAIGVLVFVNWPRKMKSACPDCQSQAIEFDRRMISFKPQEVPDGSHPVEGSHVVNRIRENFEVSFVCEKCQKRFTKEVTQTR